MVDLLLNALDTHFSDLKNINIAVGVSGGPDSMALAYALQSWSSGQVHALIVDHGLRVESAEEANAVQGRLSDMHTTEILKWNETPESCLQERARDARYGLMADYMAQNELQYLFLGHHMDDQAETFLFRLAKGSGVDGLACMSARQKQGDVVLCRPFLGLRKAELIEYCDTNALEFVQDPSNDSEVFARVRLRQSMGVLSEEGLSVERLGVAASRFLRVRTSLECLSDRAYTDSVINTTSDRIVFNVNALLNQPHEIVVRCVLRAIGDLSENAVRLQRVEALCDDLIHEAAFRKRTLAGLSFERKDEMFVITNL